VSLLKRANPPAFQPAALNRRRWQSALPLQL
jgi:hypothetical protein